MSFISASGSFDHDGWSLHQSGDDPRTAQFASAHESHHKQLQDSTSYGAVARIYHSLGVATGEPRYRRLAGRLTKASEQVQEAFASWSPAVALGWSRAQVIERYPAYHRHFDAMAGIVDSVDSLYLRLHAAHAAARACMQTTIIERVVEVGLRDFTLAHLRERELPATRFVRLRTRPPRWNAHIPASGDERPARLIDAEKLTADLFSVEFEDLWTLVNGAMYAAVVEVLGGDGTLEVNGHLDWTPALVAAARRISDATDVAPSVRTRQDETHITVLANIEAETFTVAEPLPARVLPATTPPARMAADLERPHLFMTVRRTPALFANYVLEDGAPPPATPVVTCLRRTVAETDGRHVVELLPVTDPPRVPTGDDVPLVTVVPCSLLDGVHAVSGPTALLLDVPLAPHLDLWLSAPGSRFRYAFLRIESFGRVIPFMVGVLDHLESSLPLMVRPLSHSGVRIHKAALEELYPGRDVLVEDGSFLEGRRHLDLVLAHLAGEEVRFGRG
ncbi:hypothetical protein ACRYCC_35020 [Actinomadura scrupuli]|uniref:hypothetical protein n=1 Tax=Actinomadura scrupuli TaxID=559629 RepID=UPI003D95BFBF